MCYGKLAVDVVDDYNSSKIQNPSCEDELIEIWKKHANNSGLSQANNCPKSTFLGICTAGYVMGIPPISYSSSIRNRLYGETAIKLLKASSSLDKKTPIELWQLVRTNLNKSSNFHIAKGHKYQMHVILELWKKGYIL